MNTLEVVLIVSSLSISITLIFVCRILEKDIMDMKLDLIKLYDRQIELYDNILTVAKMGETTSKRELQLSKQLLIVKTDVNKLTQGDR